MSKYKARAHLKNLAKDESSSSDDDSPKSETNIKSRNLNSKKVEEEKVPVKEKQIVKDVKDTNKENGIKSKAFVYQESPIERKYSDDSNPLSGSDEELKHNETTTEISESLEDMTRYMMPSFEESKISSTEMTNSVGNTKISNFRYSISSQSTLMIINENLEEHKLKPRDYQQSIIDEISSEENDPYGRIVSLETGLGKTFVAMRIICKRAKID